LTIEVDMAAAMALREGLNARGEGYPKISPNDLIVKAVADSLRAQPQMRVAWGGDDILTTDSVNVGVAVALDDGLIVPVVRNADAKTVTQISGEIRALAEKARAGRLLPDDYAGGTFTVTNLGMFGVADFAAIINPPEPAILAVSAIAEKPVVVDGQLAVGTRMTMTISGDHRAIDGATAARFLAEVKRRLETPGMLVG
jgi:pyruvate dehydrogenase E2 component (dihydrolipoamide acetyltransferase)